VGGRDHATGRAASHHAVERRGERRQQCGGRRVAGGNCDALRHQHRPANPASLQLSGDGSSISKSIGATRVLFDGVAAAIIYASATQVNAVSPYGLAAGATTQVQVEYLGALSSALPVPVQAAHPGLFTADASGQGGGAILNQDFSLNRDLNPAARGSVVMIYSTGGGATTPPEVDAAITPAPPAPSCCSQPNRFP